METKRISKSSLIIKISKDTGISIRTVSTVLTALFVFIIHAVTNNYRVVLRGFGTFSRKTRKQRRYKDIRTGQVSIIPERNIPSFQASQVLVKSLNPILSFETKEEKLKKHIHLENVEKKEKPIQFQIEKEKKREIKPIYSQKEKDDRPRCLLLEEKFTLEEKALIKKDKETKEKEEEEEEEVKIDVIVSKPNSLQTDSLRINYFPCHEFDSTEKYPVVYTPKTDSFLKLPREGRSNIRGYKEPEFFHRLSHSLKDINVSDIFHIKIPGRPNPYEPDIVLFDEAYNLFIDVEIDEPYDGYSRLVTHTLEGKDHIRNLFFKESGWIVVRFSEKQVHEIPDQCMAFLVNIIASMKRQVYSNHINIRTEPRWTTKQAITWEKDNYREKYLGIQFFQPTIRTKKVLCTDGIDGIDSVIERTPVYPPSPIREKNGLEDLHSGTHNNHLPLSVTHPPVLVFDEDSHSYHAPDDYTGNTDHISVTTLIDRFFPYFDEDAYIKKRMKETGMSEAEIKRELAEPSQRGTEMHKQIESFLHDPSFYTPSKEFQLFKQFYEREIIGRDLEFDSAEYEIRLHDTNIAGTVDALFLKKNGDYVMVDWKRSKNLIIDGYPKKYGFGRGLSVLSHLDNSSYYKYELQQSFYKYILEKDYEIKVSSMILAVLHPDYDRYYSIKLSEYRKQEVLDMIEAYEHIQ